MLKLKKFYFVCHMHAHDFPTPVHSLSFWDVNICYTCWGTEVDNNFFPCIARLENSVHTYGFPLSYNVHLFKGNISLHLASLSITWKTTNKNVGNFMSYLNSKLINWFEKWCPFFDISHIIWSHSHCNCIYFGTLLWYSGFYLSTSVYCLFPQHVQFVYCLLSSVAPWVGPMVETEGKSFQILVCRLL